MELPTLYSLDSGKSKIWKIKAINGIIYIKYGFEDGKQRTSELSIINIKNMKLADIIKQSEKEALDLWVQKKKNGYHEEKLPSVMLAVEYQSRRDITFPCFVQPKYDGVRALYVNKEFFSRRGERKIYNHIGDELSSASSFPFPLDGEIFTFDYSFEKIAGLCNKIHHSQEDKHDLSKLKYYVFDCAAPLDFEKRFELLQSYFRENTFSQVQLVETKECFTADSVSSIMNSYVNLGYEGTMIRNKKGEYKGGRSTNLQKLKPFSDEEFEIIGFKAGKGKSKNLAMHYA